MESFVKRELICKDNLLINSGYSLSLSQQRIILLAILEVRKQKNFDNIEKTLRIHAQTYIEIFKTDKSTAYKILKESANSLFDAEFKYKYIDQKTGKEFIGRKRFLNKVAYAEDLGCVEFSISPDFLELISRLNRCYTEYDIKRVVNLNSEYSLRLYEMMMQWKNANQSFCISLEDLRFVLGVENKYKLMCDFKKRILDFAIDEINNNTDIMASYKQHKTGRSVTGFTFSFKFKKDAIEGESKEAKPLKKLTDKQIFMFSMKLAELQEFQSVFESKSGESYSDFAERIAEELTEVENVQKWAKYLEQVGFKC